MDPIHKTPSVESQDAHSDSSTDDSDAHFGDYSTQGEGLSSSAQVHTDGRINLSLECKVEFPDLPGDHAQVVNEFAIDPEGCKNCPSMNIVIMIVGSRGDVQPYVALGLRLKKDGHHVRIATHETFRNFVTGEGLGFYSIGGNPQDLMSYMVKNPGLIPGMKSLTNGDIIKKRSMLKEMIYGCWQSCYSPCPDSGQAFTADAIISNPPGFAHIHCAEALGIPLQMSFTMPWSPTTAFPQPLVNITSSNARPGLTNYLTYEIADLLTWQGTGDIINNFRKRTLHLDTLDIRSGPDILNKLKVPWTYCMSPALVPKPDDWKNHIDVVGFYFLDLATNYEPPAELVAFLNAGEPPVYIGFGSVVVDDPQALTKLIFEATAQAGVRALVSAGWGGLGDIEVPSHIHILGNIPHDWLFDQGRVAAIVHHGGAGTTAIGLAKGCPTVVVPFFGDQGFWGSMIHKAGAGPKPILHKRLTVAKLSEAIKYAISPTAKVAAKHMAEQIRDENGVQKGLESFYRHLPLLNMRCDLDSSRLAVWWSTRHCLKLSAFAAQTLAHAGLLDMDELDLHRTKEHGPQDKSSSAENTGSVLWSMNNFYPEVAGDLLFCPVKGIVETSAAIGITRIASSLLGGSSHTKLEKEKVTPKPKETKKSAAHEPKKASLDRNPDSFMRFIRGDRTPSKKESIKDIKEILKGKARDLYQSGVRSIVCTFQNVEHQRRKARTEEGLKVFNESTGTQRAQIVKEFLDAKGCLEERQKTYLDAAKKALVRQGQQRKESILTVASSSDTATLTENPQPAKVDIAIQDKIDWDAAFEKDLALAMSLSLEEGKRTEQAITTQQDVSTTTTTSTSV